MTKEITQEERLDLTDKKKKEEKLAYLIYNSKKIREVLEAKDSEKVVIEKDVRDSILMANCDLMAENERLKKQLNDYEKALKDYAECEPIEIKREYWNGEKSSINCTMADIGVSARKTLKKWENK